MSGRVVTVKDIESISTLRDYISNGEFEINTFGWTLYKDAANPIPEDGIGPGVTALSISVSNTSPIVGANSLILTKATGVSAQGEGLSYDFTIDSRDKAKVLNISFSYIIDSGVFTLGSDVNHSDIEVYIYDINNAIIIRPSNYKLTANKFSSYFQTSSNATSYRLIFHCPNTTTTNWKLKIDNVSISPSLSLADNYSNCFLHDVIAGENLVSNDQVYMSKGNDSGRIAGKIYKVDATNASRINVLGFVQASASSGNIVSVRLNQTMSGFSGLAVGSLYYSSPITPGAITTTIPTGNNQYIIPSGIAYSQTELLINSLAGINATKIDPLYSTFVLVNNISSAVDITGMTFSQATEKAFYIDYYIIRKTDTVGSEAAQTGNIRGIYNSQLSKWLITDTFSGQNAGVTFSITAAGQIQYKTTNITGSNYIGTLAWLTPKKIGI